MRMRMSGAFFRKTGIERMGHSLSAGADRCKGERTAVGFDLDYQVRYIPSSSCRQAAFGCEAVVKSDTSVFQVNRGNRIYDCFAAERRLRQLLQIEYRLSGPARDGLNYPWLKSVGFSARKVLKVLYLQRSSSEPSSASSTSPKYQCSDSNRCPSSSS